MHSRESTLWSAAPVQRRACARPTVRARQRPAALPSGSRLGISRHSWCFFTGGRARCSCWTARIALGHDRGPAIKRCRSASAKGANEFRTHDGAPGTHAVNLRMKKSILASAALAGLDFGVHAAGYCEHAEFPVHCNSAYLSSQTSSMRQPLTMLLTITVSPFTRGCQHVAPRP